MASSTRDNALVNTLAAVGAGALGIAAVFSVKKLIDWRQSRQVSERLATVERELEATRLRAQAAEAMAAKLVEDGAGGGAASSAGAKKKVRIYIDGCFDMFHFGHSNALRQARNVGDVLVVGLIDDEEIVTTKGSPPVIPEPERYECLAACKFVDEVIRHAPYDLTPEFTYKLVEEYKIDFIVHGDDPCITADGKDAYATAKQLGRFKTIKRTEGISTTDLVGRMLLMGTGHHVRSMGSAVEEEEATRGAQYLRSRSPSIDAVTADKDVRISSFLPTSRRITQFAGGRKPKPGDKVVYCPGAWDLFNAGHVAALKAAKEFGDFMLIGIHDDTTVHEHRGSGFPIMNLHERALSVLACRYVDEIIMGAPWVITQDVIKTMNIAVVCVGQVSDQHDLEESSMVGGVDEALAVPREMGILKTFNSKNEVTALRVVDRVLKHRTMFEARYKKKMAKEAEYHAEKKYVEEG